MCKWSVVVVLLGLSSIVMGDDNTLPDSCANGSGFVVMGNNGTEYCQSKKGMNWWTAIGWCQSIGKKLVEYPMDCQCVGVKCPTKMLACPNFKGDFADYVWTATPAGSNTSYIIYPAGGSISNPDRTRMSAALCK